MSVLVTGSIGLDSVETPHGKVEDAIGGTAVHFSFAAAHFSPVRLVAVVGEDFPDKFKKIFGSKPVDTTGLEVRKGSETFRWRARFEGDMNEAETLETQLGVLGEYGPKVPSEFTGSETVFLANTHPALQRELLSQLTNPRIVVCDTMNLWIETERDALLETLGLVTGVILNDAESRQLTEKQNLIEAGEAILRMGPKFAIIKKGEHGALLITPDAVVAIPAYPTKNVKDPTGAGDSFAGGFMGYLDRVGKWDESTLKSAMVRGTVTASFAIEDFSIGRSSVVETEEVEKRVKQFAAMLRVE